MASLQRLFQDTLATAQQLDYEQRTQATLLAGVASALYLRFIASRFAPSHAALLLVVPVLVLNVVLPLLSPLDEVVPRAMWLLLLTWLANFKAIGLCWNRGPLVGNWNAAQFIMLYLMPIYPRQDNGSKKGRLADNAGGSGKVAVSFLANTALMAACAYCLAVYELPDHLRHYTYFLGLYGFITFMMEGPAAVLIGLLGLEVVPPFDKPWLSSSLADFWSRRWNNTVGLTLRALVYDPLIEGRLLNPPTTGSSTQQPHQRTPLGRKLAGMTATFVVSGLVHEWILYCVARQYNPYYWFAFFIVQAPMCVAESMVMTALRSKGMRIPRILGMAYTSLWILHVSSWFWFPPIEKHDDLAQRVVAAVNSNVATLQRFAGDVWGLDGRAAAASLASAAVSQ